MWTLGGGQRATRADIVLGCCHKYSEGRCIYWLYLCIHHASERSEQSYLPVQTHISTPQNDCPCKAVLCRESSAPVVRWQGSSETEEPKVPEAPSGSWRSLQHGLDVKGGVYFSRSSATLTKSSLKWANSELACGQTCNCPGQRDISINLIISRFQKIYFITCLRSAVEIAISLLSNSHRSFLPHLHVLSCNFLFFHFPL